MYWWTKNRHFLRSAHCNTKPKPPSHLKTVRNKNQNTGIKGETTNFMLYKKLAFKQASLFIHYLIIFFTFNLALSLHGFTVFIFHSNLFSKPPSWTFWLSINRFNMYLKIICRSHQSLSWQWSVQLTFLWAFLPHLIWPYHFSAPI